MYHISFSELFQLLLKKEHVFAIQKNDFSEKLAFYFSASYNDDMEYYIDFEATQFSNEIISVGCVDENGRTFYTLVKPCKPEKLNNFITDLTGITREDLVSAPTADEAFSNFFRWIDKTGTAEFYCYGNCDARFVKFTLRHIKDFDAQCAMSLILSTLSDFSYYAMDFFRVDQTIGLVKIVEYYSGEKIQQKHNSLEDAQYLKYVADRMQEGKPDGCPFPEYVNSKKPQDAPPPQPIFKHYIKAVKGNSVFIFPSYGKASDWVMLNLLAKNIETGEKTKSSIANKIVHAVHANKPYYGYRWSAGTNE